MYPELFKFGPVTINSYGFMIALGFLFAIMLATYRAKKLGLDEDIIFKLGLFCIIGGFAGAKILFIIIEIKNIFENPSILLNISSGFVVFGGIIGGVLTGYIYSKIKKIDFMEYFDLSVPSIALAQGFGRIGCFFAGCCYGKETNWFWGIVFKHSLYGPNEVKLIPTQLLSSVGDFLITIILLIFAKRKKDKGKIAGLYLILYSVGRFFIEILRNDPRGFIGILTTSQLISIFTLIIGLCFYNLSKLNFKNPIVGR
ncbi:MAG: prolipoprotein diacylglyceryl transferase [Clostridiaceae bacterium]|nr:prolipoprotein diacylglyceryl transferase [Clostridiaceae bacterium]